MYTDFYDRATKQNTKLELSPCISGEQDQHRVQLQTSGQHVEDQDKLGEIGVDAEILGRTDQFQTGTNVVECGGNGGEIGGQVKIIDSDQKKRHGKDKEVGCQEYGYGPDNLLVHRTSLKIDSFYCIGTQIHLNFIDDCAE